MWRSTLNTSGLSTIDIPASVAVLSGRMRQIVGTFSIWMEDYFNGMVEMECKESEAQRHNMSPVRRTKLELIFFSKVGFTSKLIYWIKIWDINWRVSSSNIILYKFNKLLIAYLNLPQSSLLIWRKIVSFTAVFRLMKYVYSYIYLKVFE